MYLLSFVYADIALRNSIPADISSKLCSSFTQRLKDNIYERVANFFRHFEQKKLNEFISIDMASQIVASKFCAEQLEQIHIS